MNKIKLERILRLYEQNNLPIEAIADHVEEDIGEVRGALMTTSEQFKENAIEGKEYISEDDLQSLYRDYKQIARYSDSDHLREKATWNLIQDGRGRLDKGVTQSADVNSVSVVMLIREEMKQARVALDVSKEDAIEILK